MDEKRVQGDTVELPAAEQCERLLDALMSVVEKMAPDAHVVIATRTDHGDVMVAEQMCCGSHTIELLADAISEIALSGEGEIGPTHSERTH